MVRAAAATLLACAAECVTPVRMKTTEPGQWAGPVVVSGWATGVEPAISAGNRRSLSIAEHLWSRSGSRERTLSGKSKK